LLTATVKMRVKVRDRNAIKGGGGAIALIAHFRATERHLSYGIPQCYLPPNTGERAPPKSQPDRPVLDLPTPDGWKAELT